MTVTISQSGWGSDELGFDSDTEQSMDPGQTGSQRFRTSDDTVRITITLAQSTNRAISELSRILNLSKSAVANQVIAKGLLIESAQARGGTIRSQMPNGEVLRLREGVEGGWVKLSVESTALGAPSAPEESEGK